MNLFGWLLIWGSIGLATMVIIDLYKWMYKYYREDAERLLRLLNMFKLEIKKDDK